jgi:hypothetical protein
MVTPAANELVAGMAGWPQSVGNPTTPCYAAQSLLDRSGMREEEPPT